jgi:hypothetical protein
MRNRVNADDFTKIVTFVRKNRASSQEYSRGLLGLTNVASRLSNEAGASLNFQRTSWVCYSIGLLLAVCHCLIQQAPNWTYTVRFLSVAWWNFFIMFRTVLGGHPRTSDYGDPSEVTNYLFFCLSYCFTLYIVHWICELRIAEPCS